MPQQKLTIVPVTLHPDNQFPSSSPAITPPYACCKIKMANLEISFFNNADEHVIQTVMRELKKLEM
ncbi:hypothetical protein SAMN05216375_10458 [Trichococcus ilyis]|uniref:Uncharacterized protein n=1 Tax=Trichococcus ilyis TaxID=640938 RepID=A0A143YIL4_9LACT|nr:hypothetical protein [Trichococcus ilyis]CZQ89468.1 Hypothetical protein TR210_799 [Trichococcus ilyis]SEI84096.1 hypothetical protein SAMN05216375_10458 [Trichococcus ilyis]